MADENSAVGPEPSSATETNNTSPTSQKQKSRRSRSKADKRVSSSKAAKRQRYSEEERAKKISQIEALLSDGQTLKVAIKEVGISEQTYYNWKGSVANFASRQISAYSGPPVQVSAS